MLQINGTRCTRIMNKSRNQQALTVETRSIEQKSLNRTERVKNTNSQSLSAFTGHNRDRQRQPGSLILIIEKYELNYLSILLTTL